MTPPPAPLLYTGQRRGDVGPTVEAVALDADHLDAQRWIVLSPLFIDGEAHQDSDHADHVIRRSWCVRLCSHHVADVTALKLSYRLVTMIVAEALKDAAIGRLSGVGEVRPLGAPVVFRD